ncbi:MAG: hypothetical protein J5700_07635, partial [Treponema sp.]|nr:hypothetical protein [Treponema sp.]
MLKKRTWIIIAAGAALALAIVLFLVAKINLNTVRVAFYGVDQRTEASVKSQIDKMNLRRVRYYDLDANVPLPNKVQKNYSILIAKNSFELNSRAEFFVPVNENLFEALPISIRKATVYGQKHYAIPLLLDHFEIAYYEVSQKKLGLERPQ